MSPSAYTRSKTGALADVIGCLGNDVRNGLVQVKPSTICDGLGVFATRRIYPGTIITRYTATVMRDDEIKDHDYAMEKEADSSCPDREIYVGVSDISLLNGLGVAQLVNDAISPSLTNRRNNARLITIARGPYIQALEIIEPNDEILAAYGFGYWQSVTHSNPEKFSQKLLGFVNLGSILQTAIKTINKDKTIHELGVFDHDIIEVILCQNSYVCPYTHGFHNDDKIRLRLVKIEDGRCEIYQVCYKCGKGNRMLDVYRLSFFEDNDD